MWQSWILYTSRLKQQGNKLSRQIVLDNSNNKYDWTKALLRYEGKNDAADIWQNA